MEIKITLTSIEELESYLEFVRSRQSEKVVENPKVPEMNDVQKEKLVKIHELEQRVIEEKKKLFEVPEIPQIDNTKSKSFFNWGKKQ